MSFSEIAKSYFGAPPSEFDLHLRRQKMALQEKNRYLPGSPDYYLALSLGRGQEPSCLACIERNELPDRLPNNRKQYHFTLRALKRWVSGTPYVQIGQEVCKVFAAPHFEGSDLAIDKTGVGDAILRIVRNQKPKARIMPVTLASGQYASVDRDGWNVPRGELIAMVQGPFEDNRLLIPKLNGDCDVLIAELPGFLANIGKTGLPAGEVEWRTNQNYDLVLSVAIACWLGGRTKMELW